MHWSLYGYLWTMEVQARSQVFRFGGGSKCILERQYLCFYYTFKTIFPDTTNLGGHKKFGGPPPECPPGCGPVQVQHWANGFMPVDAIISDCQAMPHFCKRCWALKVLAQPPLMVSCKVSVNMPDSVTSRDHLNESATSYALIQVRCLVFSRQCRSIVMRWLILFALEWSSKISQLKRWLVCDGLVLFVRCGTCRAYLGRDVSIVRSNKLLLPELLTNRAIAVGD